MTPNSFQRIDSNPIPANRAEIRAFMTVRDEALRLPSTLRHHRELGVDRFFIVDNGSTDGTLDLLTKEPNVHIFTTTESYADSHFGVFWMNAMLDAFGDGHWTLTIDADEQLIYPNYEEMKLPQFCAHLDHVKAQALFCIMLDMYSTRPVAETVHDPSRALIDTCRYFDNGEYRFLPIPLCPHFKIHGGVRQRMFCNDEKAWATLTISKVPLVRWRKGFRFLYSTHSLSPVTTAKVTGALFHFKFLSDFHDRVETEVARGEHHDNAREYQAYRDFMSGEGVVNFISDKSVRFENSRQLERLGLMFTDEVFERSMRTTQAARAALQPTDFI